VPYPSFLPGEGNSKFTRCVPKFNSNDNPNSTGAFQEMLATAAADMVKENQNFVAQVDILKRQLATQFTIAYECRADVSEFLTWWLSLSIPPHLKTVSKP